MRGSRPSLLHYPSLFSWEPSASSASRRMWRRFSGSPLRSPRQSLSFACPWRWRQYRLARRRLWVAADRLENDSNIIFLYRLTDVGLFKVLQDSISGITDDRRLQLLLIAFCFGAFFEGAAGFGTPVAVTGSNWIGLGFSPLAASGLSRSPIRRQWHMARSARPSLRSLR